MDNILKLKYFKKIETLVELKELSIIQLSIINRNGLTHRMHYPLSIIQLSIKMIVCRTRSFTTHHGCTQWFNRGAFRSEIGALCRFDLSLHHIS